LYAWKHTLNIQIKKLFAARCPLTPIFSWVCARGHLSVQNCQQIDSCAPFLSSGHLPAKVIRVQILLRLLAQRRSEELLVDLLDLRIFMGEAELHVPVKGVEVVTADPCQLLPFIISPTQVLEKRSPVPWNVALILSF
jgi:hypothetical protein